MYHHLQTPVIMADVGSDSMISTRKGGNRSRDPLTSSYFSPPKLDFPTLSLCICLAKRVGSSAIHVPFAATENPAAVDSFYTA